MVGVRIVNQVLVRSAVLQIVLQIFLEAVQGLIVRHFRGVLRDHGLVQTLLALQSWELIKSGRRVPLRLP